MDLIIDASRPPHAGELVEVVERKGLGHPDTLCDAIAERISIRLCRAYLDNFGSILHHNVDKVLLCGGRSRPAFGGGEVLEPIEIYLGGRATAAFRGVDIPIHDLAIAACRELLAERVPLLDSTRDVRISSRLRPGSSDLTQLFGKGGRVPLANDTSCGAGFAPRTPLERAVLAIEHGLNSPETKQRHAAVGSDIKVMGVRSGQRVALTVSCAFIGRQLANFDAYVAARGAAQALAHSVAAEHFLHAPELTLNAADDDVGKDVFLTVTGTSAEAGDDGEVGRGNRVGGLITPYRCMTMEAAAGKNPVSHVGKLYHFVANAICERIVAQLPGSEAECILVSQIGRPVDDPQLVHVRMCLPEPLPEATLRPMVSELVRAELGRMTSLPEELIAEKLSVY